LQEWRQKPQADDYHEYYIITPTWWLEPIEITEEEIEKIIHEYVLYRDIDGEIKGLSLGANKAASIILSKLKGE